MYLTRFRINPARRDARKLLTSPQAMHAAVLAGFPHPEDHTRSDARTLWRLDQSTDRQITLYIVSPGQPDLTHLVEQAGWPTIDTWLTRPYQPFLDTLQNGQQWAFRLTANPVRSGRRKDGDDTQRYGHLTADQQTRWLRERTERNGFIIADQPDGQPNLLLHQRQSLRFTRRRGERPVSLVTATYDGVLTIQDVDGFRAALTRGIGHARAYGCGLLTLAPTGRP
ncbi:type I-E CRISPR-associated protein Cas6/Cse3/CasE [Actinoplanes teichomyceticus]|uniref:CRISPR-associated Cse3 family protein n=1 Tax=Actinoplanes teichomyceticus TaxID=1867 RepID=A0A561VSB2_ACTTI|nr:type I-E CRISPR-associated protein Cas6/Cse3/CasE [Actinoplanes teichomyceticus]TWG14480.1 CRISPR-associated Cse3 family protein [Actinoplanes teichomyceticus]